MQSAENKPLVDIVIPVYNVKPFLKRCLESIIAQTYEKWRAICVDDGSTDGCGEILDSYASEDGRFMVVHKENGGLSDARNAGVRMSDAPYVMFVDSDDMIHPQTIEIAVSLIQRDGTDMVSWYRDSTYMNIQLKLYRLVGKDTIAARPWGMKRRFDVERIRSFRTSNLIEHCSDWKNASSKYCIKHCYVWRHLFKMEVIEKIDFIKGLYYEDIPWWSKVMLEPISASITNLPLYYYYHTNPSSITRSTSLSRKTRDILYGLRQTHLLYQSNASQKQRELWSHNIKWAVLCGMARRYRLVDSENLDMQLKWAIDDLYEQSVFSDASTSKELKAKKIFETLLAK